MGQTESEVGGTPKRRIIAKLPYTNHSASSSLRVFAALIMGWSFPGGSAVKNSPAKCRRGGFIPWIRKIPGEGNGNPLQHSCLGNPMDGGAWWATVPGVTKESDTTG